MQSPEPALFLQGTGLTDHYRSDPMSDVKPPRLTLFFPMLFAAQTILFPLLAPESTLFSLLLTGH